MQLFIEIAIDLGFLFSSEIIAENPHPLKYSPYFYSHNIQRMENPNPKQEWFKEWFDSPYYHILYKQRDENEARQFIDRLLAVLQPPAGARMLDLACGRGRHACYLAERGFEVTGLDLSENNIQYAHQFEGPQLNFYTHDMRLLFRTNYFDYIFNMFTSFGYFQRERDHLRTLQNVHAGLRPAGIFVLDFFNSILVRKNLKAFEEKLVDDIAFSIQKEILGGRIIKTIDFFDGGRRHHFIESVRLFTLEDLQTLFRRAGLTIFQTYGDYELHTFDPEISPRLILTAKKDDGITTTG